MENNIVSLWLEESTPEKLKGERALVREAEDEKGTGRLHHC